MVVLGVFAVNRMTLIRQASVDMSSNQLPSVAYLGSLTENALRMRISSFRVLVNREPAALQEAQTRIAALIDKVRAAQAGYSALPSVPEEAALYKTFVGTLDNYLTAQAEMLALSQQNKVDEMRDLINTRIKNGTDQMGEQLNKLIALNSAGAKQANEQAGTQLRQRDQRDRRGGRGRRLAHGTVGLVADPQHRHAAAQSRGSGANHCRRRLEQSH